MKIGVMGLGTIAQKAYLPIMGAMQEIDWVIQTRNLEKLNALQAKYNFKEAYTDFNAFLFSGIEACFIHTPTYTHYQFIKIMLEHNIHVFVDKPISDDIIQIKELLDLAKEKNLILMTGFNRRFAPLTNKLKEIPDKNMIVIRKNRPDEMQDTHFSLYDMMTHVVDTALYLLDEPIIETASKVVETDTKLNRATLTLETKNTTLFAYMNMQSGARAETFEVMSSKGHFIVEDLNTMIIKTDSHDTTLYFPDWTPTLERRGFQNMIETFVNIIKENKSYSTRLDLQTHRLIHAMLKSK